MRVLLPLVILCNVVLFPAWSQDFGPDSNPFELVNQLTEELKTKYPDRYDEIAKSLAYNSWGVVPSDQVKLDLMKSANPELVELKVTSLNPNFVFSKRVFVNEKLYQPYFSDIDRFREGFDKHLIIANLSYSITILPEGQFLIHNITVNVKVKNDDDWFNIASLGASNTWTFEGTNPTKQHMNHLVDLVVVEGGSFDMGSKDPKDFGAKPVHKVSLGSYYVGKTEVPLGLFKEIMGYSNSWSGNDLVPATRVSFFEALEFCNRLSIEEGLKPAYTITGQKITFDQFANGYRLPSEAQWEFAARGGNLTQHFTYSGSNDLSEVAIHRHSRDLNVVESKLPNELGLFGMNGNASEWCFDWYSAYDAKPSINPQGPTEGKYRVVRGGSFANSKDYVRIGLRFYREPKALVNDLGFRVCLPAE